MADDACDPLTLFSEWYDIPPALRFFSSYNNEKFEKLWKLNVMTGRPL